MKDLEEIVAAVVKKEITAMMKPIEELEKLKKLVELFQHGTEIPSSVENSKNAKKN